MQGATATPVCTFSPSPARSWRNERSGQQGKKQGEIIRQQRAARNDTTWQKGGNEGKEQRGKIEQNRSCITPTNKGKMNSKKGKDRTREHSGSKKGDEEEKKLANLQNRDHLTQQNASCEQEADTEQRVQGGERERAQTKYRRGANDDLESLRRRDSVTCKSCHNSKEPKTVNHAKQARSKEGNQPTRDASDSYNNQFSCKIDCILKQRQQTRYKATPAAERTKMKRKTRQQTFPCSGFSLVIPLFFTHFSNVIMPWLKYPFFSLLLLAFFLLFWTDQSSFPLQSFLRRKRDADQNDVSVVKLLCLWYPTLPKRTKRKSEEKNSTTANRRLNVPRNDEQKKNSKSSNRNIVHDLSEWDSVIRGLACWNGTSHKCVFSSLKRENQKKTKESRVKESRPKSGKKSKKERKETAE